MDNLLLLSMLGATVVVPALAARARDGRRALAWMLLGLLLFTLGYTAAVTRYYVVHGVPETFAP